MLQLLSAYCDIVTHLNEQVGVIFMAIYNVTFYIIIIVGCSSSES